jgi:hypothetical protein
MDEPSKDYEHPECQLIGENGNIFNLTGIASKTLKRAGHYDMAKEMWGRVTNSQSYDEALGVISLYVDVS